MKSKYLRRLSDSEISSRLMSISEDLHFEFYLGENMPYNKRLFLSALILELRQISVGLALSDSHEK